jgi:hypothetical protein
LSGNPIRWTFPPPSFLAVAAMPIIPPACQQQRANSVDGAWRDYFAGNSMIKREQGAEGPQIVSRDRHTVPIERRRAGCCFGAISSESTR